MNPWNRQQYTGAWRDDDPRWTDTMKEIVGFNDKAGGEFFINIFTLVTFFNNISVCKIDKSLNETTIKMSHEKGEYCLAAVKVRSPNSKLMLRVRQQTYRFFPESTGYKADPVRILIGRKTNDSSRPIEYVTGDFRRLSESDFDIEIPNPEEGDIYLIYIELDWTNDIINDFSL